jgi:hypothetical protein
MGWLVVAAQICTNRDRWILRGGGSQRVGSRWWWQDSAQISTVGFCCQKISARGGGGVVKTSGKWVGGDRGAAQIVTVGFVAEDLERERSGQLVGGRSSA